MKEIALATASHLRSILAIELPQFKPVLTIESALCAVVLVAERPLLCVVSSVLEGGVVVEALVGDEEGGAVAESCVVGVVSVSIDDVCFMGWLDGPRVNS